MYGACTIIYTTPIDHTHTHTHTPTQKTFMQCMLYNVFKIFERKKNTKKILTWLLWDALLWRCDRSIQCSLVKKICTLIIHTDSLLRSSLEFTYTVHWFLAFLGFTNCIQYSVVWFIAFKCRVFYDLHWAGCNVLVQSSNTNKQIKAQQ